MEIGTTYRYGRPYGDTRQVGTIPNYFRHVTPGTPLLLLEKGINAPAETAAIDGRRRCAVLISSSPHKRGSESTPWHDRFDPDNGRITYYGDNKAGIPGAGAVGAANAAPGNRILLEQFLIHSSPDRDVRKHAVPLIFFERTTVDGKQKGHVVFQGFGVVTGATLVTQHHASSGRYFPNYQFEFCVFSLAEESERFDWNWIAARRDPKRSLDETLWLAPRTWQRWVAGGNRSLESCRRRVLRLPVVSSTSQVPARGSREHRILQNVYDRYGSRRSEFENVASYVTAHHFAQSGMRYSEGWITPTGADSGIDFVGRIDVGDGLAGTQLVVLGQAKCEILDRPTGGNHIARTVARLQRGWLGAYVTTSHFSEAVQREVQIDRYPVVLLNGRRLAEILELRAELEGFESVERLLRALDARYERILARKPPEAVLLYSGLPLG